MVEVVEKVKAASFEKKTEEAILLTKLDTYWETLDVIPGTLNYFL